jgi:hypothetical protein
VNNSPIFDEIVVVVIEWPVVENVEVQADDERNVRNQNHGRGAIESSAVFILYAIHGIGVVTKFFL